MTVLAPTPRHRAWPLLAALALLLAFAAPAAVLAQNHSHDDDSDSDDNTIIWSGPGKVFELKGACDDGDDCPRTLWLGPHVGGYLGIEMTQLSGELRRHFGVPEDAGVMIAKVANDSPAAAAGLRAGDILTAIEGEPVASSLDVGRKVRRADDGTALSIELYRDRRPMTVTATVSHRENPWVDVSSMVSDALEGVDFHAITRDSLHLGEASMREALESVRHVFEGQDWERHMERVRDIDYDQLEVRMEELRERLRELEERLNERFDDDPDS